MTIVRITRSGFAPPASARLEKLVRQRAQSGAQREEHERRVLDAQHQDYSSRRVQRIAAAERRGDAQHLEQRTRRPGHLQPRERHDLRRQHQRHHEAEDERVAAADVGKRHEQRHDAPERDGECRPAEGSHEAVRRRRPCRVARQHAAHGFAGWTAARHDAFEHEPRERQHREESDDADQSPEDRVVLEAPARPEAFAIERGDARVCPRF